MRYFVVCVLIFLVDQVSKQWVSATMQEGESIPLVKPLLYITYVENPGAAFGLLAGHTEVLVVISLVGVVVGWCYRRQLLKQGEIARWGMTLAAAGALGNLVDRVRLGRVIDFLDIRVWPVFNVADMFIVGGVLLLFWEVLRDAPGQR